MFGYVRPLKSELKVREYESFRAMYCGLCHTIRRRYGIGSRMILSYDMCFLAVLMAGATDCGIKTCARRCPVSPFRKRACVHENSALDFAADCCVVLTYWKLRDSAADERGYKKLGAKTGELFFRRKYKKACLAVPVFAEAARQGIESLLKIERDNTPSLDIAADAFARILEAAAGGIEDERIRRPAGQVLYHVGRWIYIADAWDDLECDLKSGAYNPIIARYGIKNADEAGNTAEAIGITLVKSLETAAAAAELMELGRCDPIIKNILYLGLGAMTESVMDGSIKQRSSKHGSL